MHSLTILLLVFHIPQSHSAQSENRIRFNAQEWMNYDIWDDKQKMITIR